MLRLPVFIFSLRSITAESASSSTLRKVGQLWKIPGYISGYLFTSSGHCTVSIPAQIFHPSRVSRLLRNSRQDDPYSYPRLS